METWKNKVESKKWIEKNKKEIKVKYNKKEE
jgi:hypothetical protein